MFHKCIADGKKLFLWISDLKWATRSLVSWPQVGVLGEDESSVSGFGVRQAKWSCLKYIRLQGVEFKFVYQGRGI